MIDDKDVERQIELGNYDEFLNGETSWKYKFECVKDMMLSGLTPKTLAMAGVTVHQPLTPASLKKELNMDKLAARIYEEHKLIMFPYPSGLKRYKVIPQLEDIKYIQPKDTFPETYCLPIVEEVKAKPHKPIWIVEGEKKTLCLIQYGEHCIGIGGVWLFPNLSGWHLKGRECYIGFDADLNTNPNVRAALYELAFKLYNEGAVVKIAAWQLQNGKGIDDYIINQPDRIKAIAELKASAVGLIDFCVPEHTPEIIRALSVAKFQNEADVINKVSKRIDSKPKELKSMVVSKRKVKIQEELNSKRKDEDLKFSKACGLTACCHTIPSGYEMVYSTGFNKPDKIRVVRFDQDGNTIDTEKPLCDAFGIQAYVEQEGEGMQMILKNPKTELLCSTAISDVRKVDQEICSKFLGRSMTRFQIEDLIRYIADYQQENEINVLKGLKDLGWASEEYHQFNIPSRFDFRVYWLDQRLVEAYSIKGDVTVQEQTFRYMMKTPASIVALGCLASPAMAPHMVQNLTLHIWGIHPMIGKTVSNMLGVSLFGNPKKLKKTWNSSEVGKEITGANNQHMPTLLDDWENAGDNKKAAKAVINHIYGWEDAGGRIRGNKNVTLREQMRYAGITLSSGEKDLDTLVSEIRGERNVSRGAFRRIIQINANGKWMMPFDSEEDAEQLFLKGTVDTAKKNYGYIGVEWIKWLEKNMTQITNLYNYYLPQIKAGGSEGFFALLYAILHCEWMAQYIDQSTKDRLHQYIGELYQAQEQINHEIVNITDEFMQYLQDFCIHNGRSIYGAMNWDIDKVTGCMGMMENDTDVFLLSSTVEKICKDRGFPLKAVLGELKKSGKLRAANKFGIQRTILGKRLSGYLFVGVFEKADNPSWKNQLLPVMDEENRAYFSG